VASGTGVWAMLGWNNDDGDDDDFLDLGLAL
jgi:hypothetical protein